VALSSSSEQGLLLEIKGKELLLNFIEMENVCSPKVKIQKAI